MGWAGGAAAVEKTKLPFIAANDDADTSVYTPLQKKSAEVVSQQKNIAQFLDRDTRPDFASTVVIPAFQSFLKTPDDIDGLTLNTGIEDFAIVPFEAEVQ